MRRLILLLGLISFASSSAFADGTIDTLTPGGALIGTESIPMFQTGNPAVKTSPAAFGTYLSGLALTFTNKTINCANNTCTVRLGSDVTGNLPISNIASIPASTLLGNPTGALAVPSTITLGTNLTFSGGVLNASSTASTAFSALTGSTNTTAAMLVGTGASLGATGSGTITATTMLATGLTGTVNAAQMPAYSGDVASAAGTTTNTIQPNAVTYAKMQTETASTLLGNPTGAVAVPSPITLGTGLSFSGGVLNATAGGGATTYYSGVLTGGPTAYTIATTTPSGFTNAPNAMVCTNTGALAASAASATLNVGSTSAFAINQQSIAGSVAAPVGAIQPAQNICFLETSATGPWVLRDPPVGTIYQDVNRTISAGDFAAASVFDEATAGLTYTLLNRGTTTILNTGSIVTVLTHQFSAVLQAAGTDVINNGAPEASAAGGSIIIPPNIVAVLTAGAAAGAGAWRVTLGPIVAVPFTWAEGLNLSAAPRYVSNMPQGLNLLKIVCNVQTAAGSASVVHLFATASGTAPASGTALDTTGCNANAVSNTDQTVTLAAGPPAIPAGSTIWATFSGTGTAGNGGLTIIGR